MAVWWVTLKIQLMAFSLEGCTAEEIFEYVILWWLGLFDVKAWQVDAGINCTMSLISFFLLTCFYKKIFSFSADMQKNPHD